MTLPILPMAYGRPVAEIEAEHEKAASGAVITADAMTEAICQVLNEQKLYLVKPQHPTLGEVALEAYGFGRACDAVALQPEDISTFGARVAGILAAGRAK